MQEAEVRHPCPPDRFRSEWMRLGVVCAAAVLLAAVWVRLDGRLRVPVPSPSITRVSAVDLRDELHARPGALVPVDARDPLLFRMGRIPDAVNLPARTLDPSADPSSLPVWDRIRRAPEGVVVYCGDAACRDSERVAVWIQRQGIARVRVLAEGWQGWMAIGGEVVRGE